MLQLLPYIFNILRFSLCLLSLNASAPHVLAPVLDPPCLSQSACFSYHCLLFPLLPVSRIPVIIILIHLTSLVGSKYFQWIEYSKLAAILIHNLSDMIPFSQDLTAICEKANKRTFHCSLSFIWKCFEGCRDTVQSVECFAYKHEGTHVKSWRVNIYSQLQS